SHLQRASRRGPSIPRSRARRADRGYRHAIRSSRISGRRGRDGCGGRGRGLARPRSLQFLHCAASRYGGDRAARRRSRNAGSARERDRRAFLARIELPRLGERAALVRRPAPARSAPYHRPLVPPRRSPAGGAARARPGHGGVLEAVGIGDDRRARRRDGCDGRARGAGDHAEAKVKSPGARTLLVAAALCVAGSSSATAQGSAPSQAEQVPRFLRMSADASREPTLVNPSDSPVLNHRIGINLRDVSAGTALREIAMTAGIQFVYASDILPRGGAIRLQADNITVAAALTEVLRGAGVDVAIGANGNLILVRKPPARVTAPVGAPSVRASERAVELAPIRTVAVAESRRTFELQPTMGHLELDVKELAAAPALFEGDLLRTVQLLPGVETRNDYSTGLNVRGGESDQNLILLDG